MSSVASRVAVRFLTSMDKSMALSLAEMVKVEIAKKVPGVNWDWDVRGLNDGDNSPGFGWSGKNFSFPGKPDVFTEEGIFGGLLVKGSMAADLANGTANAIDLDVGYYNKLSTSGQEYTKIHDLGMYGVTISPKGIPTFDPGQNIGMIGTGFQELVEDIYTNPPAVSQSKQFLKKRSLRKLSDAILLKKHEEMEADMSTHGSIEAFAKYIHDEADGVYGPPDLAKLLNYITYSQADRIAQRPRTIAELRELGCTFDPHKTRLSCLPDDVSAMLCSVAAAIDASDRPSKSAVVADLRAVMDALEP